MRVLIVDDSKAMRLIVMRELRKIGYGDISFREASNGQEALAAVLDDRPTLILADWNMPEMNGMELLEELKARDIRVPFGFVTAEGTPEMRRLAAQAGARFVVVKPFTADDLQAAIDSVSIDA
jgi:two-component system chemotaxis response regulator CheY